MADDLVQRLRSVSLSEWEHGYHGTFIDCEDYDASGLENIIQDAADALARKDAEIAELRSVARKHELWAMEAQARAIQCEEIADAAIAERDTLRQRAERAEARVREAPVACPWLNTAGRLIISAQSMPIEWANKPVALVLLETEEAK